MDKLTQQELDKQLKLNEGGIDDSSDKEKFEKKIDEQFDKFLIFINNASEDIKNKFTNMKNYVKQAVKNYKDPLPQEVKDKLSVFLTDIQNDISSKYLNGNEK